MKKRLVTYGGYVLAACLLVTLAVSQNRIEPVEQEAHGVSKILAAKQVMMTPFGDLGTARRVAYDKALEQFADGYSEVVSDPETFEAMFTMTSMQLYLTMGLIEETEIRDDLFKSMGIELQLLQVAQNQRIIELLEGMSEN